MKLRRSIVAMLCRFFMVNSGCQKDELTIPVKMNFLIGLNNTTEQSDYISFSQGTISISTIAFEGKRHEGKDIVFTTNPTKRLGIHQFESYNLGTAVTHFDIPQGIYYYMSFVVNMSNLDVDIEPYDFDEESVGLVITGSYTTLSGTKIPVVIAIDTFEQFKVQGIFASGDGEITLSDTKTYTALLQVDMNYTLSPITRNTWENAEIETNDNTLQIEISSDSNEAIYEQILFRIQKSAKITVQ